MSVFLDPIEPEYIQDFFSSFFHEAGLFFEIISDDVPIGFYSIKTITDKVCEIHAYSKKIGGWKLTKKVLLKCLKFPFSLGFEKVFVGTESKRLMMLLSRMKKYGIEFLTEHKDRYFFEVKL